MTRVADAETFVSAEGVVCGTRARGRPPLFMHRHGGKAAGAFISSN
jgi:hypothetical protein